MGVAPRQLQPIAPSGLITPSPRPLSPVAPSSSTGTVRPSPPSRTPAGSACSAGCCQRRQPLGSANHRARISLTARQRRPSATGRLRSGCDVIVHSEVFVRQRALKDHISGSLITVIDGVNMIQVVFSTANMVQVFFLKSAALPSSAFFCLFPTFVRDEYRSQIGSSLPIINLP